MMWDFLLRKNFFDSFSNNDNEDGLFKEFKDFLSFDLNLKAKANLDDVSFDAIYEYESNVLDAGFGLKVASKLDTVKDGELAKGMDSVFGEFMEIFLQRLDFQTVSQLIERINLSQTTGFEQFEEIKVNTKTKNQNVGIYL